MTVSERRNTARFSANGIYRYLLTRSLGGSATCLFIMLNPSSADAENDDPTIRRCIGFANREGYGRLEVIGPCRCCHLDYTEGTGFQFYGGDDCILDLNIDPQGRTDSIYLCHIARQVA